MNPEELKAKVTRLYDELNRSNVDVIREIMDPHFVAHGETMRLDPNDTDQLAALVRGIEWEKWVFPDLYVSVDDVVAEGDKVTARLTWRGTMSQEVYGVPPNHQMVEWTGITIDRFENGRIVERWFNRDELGMMRGMGLMPSGGGAAPAGGDQQAAEQPQTSMTVESPVGAPVSDPQLEANKQIVRRFYEYVFNEVHTEALKEIMDEDFVDHGEALFGSPHGRAMLEGGIAGFRALFPNAGVTLQDIVAEGDMVGVRGVMHLKHDVPWLGREATGKMLTWNGLSMFRIRDGKITDRFFNSDSLYILEQLGYWPVK